MDRREFVETTAATTLASRLSGVGHRAPEPPASFELEEKPIAELQAMMTAGRMTSRRLVDLYTRRIADLDQRGPRLNHVLEVNPDARHLAEQSDVERRAGTMKSPLHGIPILIKDN